MSPWLPISLYWKINSPFSIRHSPELINSSSPSFIRSRSFPSFIGCYPFSLWNTHPSHHYRIHSQVRTGARRSCLPGRKTKTEGLFVTSLRRWPFLSLTFTGLKKSVQRWKEKHPAILERSELDFPWKINQPKTFLIVWSGSTSFSFPQEQKRLSTYSQKRKNQVLFDFDFCETYSTLKWHLRESCK